MKIQVEVFSIVTPCTVAVEYQCFKGPWCLHLHTSTWRWSQHGP